MKIFSWYQKRGFQFILARGKKLYERYGISPNKAAGRIRHSLRILEPYHVLPTFFVPAVVVKRNKKTILSLQDQGCEIGVHGFNHVDLKAYPPEESSRQLLRGVDVFQASGLAVHGFRCPYLSATDELIQALPANVFSYSSNKAVEWPYERRDEKEMELLFSTIYQFYLPVKGEIHQSLPWMQNGFVEIPVSVPDDLQFHDGLGYNTDQLAQAWLDIFLTTYVRGELLNLMYHPELADFCETPIVSVLDRAQTLAPRVWKTQLCEISAWWREKEAFSVESAVENGRISLRFHCTPRATLLCRNFESEARTSPWFERYALLQERELTLAGDKLPFIGLAPDAPAWVGSALKRNGYLIEDGDNAERCSTYLDGGTLDRFTDPVSLVGYLENLDTPLVRFWPWPDGARSAVCLTGDLDALSLIDYATRLFVR